MSTFSTMYDHQVHAGSELGRQVASDVIKKNPLLAFLPMRPVNGLLLNTEILEAIPSLSPVSNINEGYDATKGEYVPKDFKLATWRDKSHVDIAFEDLGQGYGVNQEIDRQIAVTNMSIGHSYSGELFDGDQSVNAKGFDGVAKATNDLALANVVSAGGSGSDLTSIYFLKMGEDGLMGLFNGSAVPTMIPMGIQNVTGANGKQFPAYQTDHKFVAGAYINPVGVGRMANIKAGQLPTLSLMNEIDAFMKNGYDVIVTGRKGKQYLNDLSGNNLTPFVTDDVLKTGLQSYNGVPIVATDFITQTETTVA